MSAFIFAPAPVPNAGFENFALRDLKVDRQACYPDWGFVLSAVLSANTYFTVGAHGLLAVGLGKVPKQAQLPWYRLSHWLGRRKRLWF